MALSCNRARHGRLLRLLGGAFQSSISRLRSRRRPWPSRRHRPSWAPRARTSGCPPSTARRYARDDFAAAPVLVRDVHLQPLPLRQGGRGSAHPPRRASTGRAACSSSASARTTPRPTRTTPSTSSRDALARARATASLTCTTSRRTSRAPSAPSARPTSSSTTGDSRRLAYRGRIDDSWKDESKVTRRELAEALDALLRGQAAVRASSGPRWGARSNGGSRTREPRRAGGGAEGGHRKDAKGHWRDYLRARGSRRRSSARRSSTRSCARRATSALEDLLSSRAPQAAERRPRDRLPHRQAARGGGHRGRAPLRPRPDAVRGVRGPRPPRSPHLRRCGFIIEFENDEIEQLQDDGGQAASASTSSATATSCSACARRPAGSPAAAAPARPPAAAGARSQRRSVSRRRACVGVF